MRALLLILALIAAAPGFAHHTTTPRDQICDHAARSASARHDVPFEIMRALTRTETGRPREGQLEPWPWTINMEGAGHWFDTRAEALRFALDHHARGARSFDVGCFQINFRWHGQAFDSIETMFDQDLNADYAARFLKDLKAEGGDWTRAVGKYHSRTPDLAAKYTGRFQRILANLTPVDPAPAPPQDQPPEEPGVLIAGLGVRLSTPQHAPLGGVALTAFDNGKSLLTRAKPLFGIDQ
ncbi:MAG: lytic transglycosylase domain-containing protein [Pseudomonadota bacterium]